MGKIIKSQDGEPVEFPEGLKYGNQSLPFYEEGTWIPTFEPRTGSFGSKGNLSTSGFFKRIGKMVFVSGQMFWDGSSTSLGTAGSVLDIAGLPFTSSSSNRSLGTFTSRNLGFPDPATRIVSLSVSASKDFIETNEARSNSTPNGWAASVFTSAGSGANLLFSIWYAID